MKTLIAYCTTHGCSEKTASELKMYLGEDAVLCNLKKEKTPGLKNFDRVIIGGSIHAGKIQKTIQHFCTKNLDTLKQMELGLFICCMEEGENARNQLQNVFPEELQEIAKASACLGGEFNFGKMNFIEKFVVRKIAHVEESVSKIDHSAIEHFSNRMDKIFNPFLFLS